MTCVIFAKCRDSIIIMGDKRHTIILNGEIKALDTEKILPVGGHSLVSLFGKRGFEHNSGGTTDFLKAAQRHAASHRNLVQNAHARGQFRQAILTEYISFWTQESQAKAPGTESLNHLKSFSPETSDGIILSTILILEYNIFLDGFEHVEVTVKFNATQVEPVLTGITTVSDKKVKFIQRTSPEFDYSILGAGEGERIALRNVDEKVAAKILAEEILLRSKSDPGIGNTCDAFTLDSDGYRLFIDNQKLEDVIRGDFSPPAQQVVVTV